MFSYIIDIDTNVATTFTAASGATGSDAVTARSEEKDEGGDEIVETAVEMEEVSSDKEDDVLGEVQQEENALIIEEEGGGDDDYQEYLGSLVDEAKGSMPNDALFGLSVNTSIDKAAASIGEAAQSFLRSPTIQGMLSFRGTTTTAKSIEDKPRRSSRLNRKESN